MPAESLRFCMEDGLLTASVDGQQVLLQLRGKEGAAP